MTSLLSTQVFRSFSSSLPFALIRAFPSLSVIVTILTGLPMIDLEKTLLFKFD